MEITLAGLVVIMICRAFYLKGYTKGATEQFVSDSFFGLI